MRRFLICLAAYAALLSFGGAAALDIDKADAGKMVWVKCAKKSKAIPYPHFNGTRARCGAPGFLIRVPYWWARKIGTYPILLAVGLSEGVDSPAPSQVRSPTGSLPGAGGETGSPSGPLTESNRACVGGKPKVVRTVGASSWRLVGQRCVKQRID